MALRCGGVVPPHRVAVQIPDVLRPAAAVIVRQRGGRRCGRDLGGRSCGSRRHGLLLLLAVAVQRRGGRRRQVVRVVQLVDGREVVRVVVVEVVGVGVVLGGQREGVQGGRGGRSVE